MRIPLAGWLVVAGGLSFAAGFGGALLFSGPVRVELAPAGPVTVEGSVTLHSPRAGLFGAASDPAPAPREKPAELEHRLPPSELVPETVHAGAEIPLPWKSDAKDWGHAHIGVADAWKHTKGKGVVVAVLDTGVDQDHRDLKGQVLKVKDFTGSRSGPSDVSGHGSHCAGVVAAAENGVGMVGVAPEAKLLVGKVLNDRGSGLSSWIAAGIDWAVDEGADVISMSLGSGASDPRIKAAVERAASKGVIVVAAAGNEGPGDGTVGFPGRYPECVCVAAVDSKGKVAEFSSRGERVDIAAPGVSVRSCYPGDRFATMSGTSMATPYVAGVAALYVADRRNHFATPSPAEFRKLLTQHAKDIPPPGRDNASGFGLAQPARLVGMDHPILVPPPGGDRLEITIPDEFKGRPIKRIVIEFEKVEPKK